MRIEKQEIFISVVIPVYQSEKTLGELFIRVKKVLEKIGKNYEIIFIDDGSLDDSWKKLEEIFNKNNHVRVIQLTQNYGQHNALMCGFANSKGKYAVTLDDDLQNPPEEIPKIISEIKQGYDVVYGEYVYKNHPFFRNLGSSLIQLLYKKIFQINGNLTSFRIIRREFVDKLLIYNRNYIFIDGLLAWHTKNIGYVKVRHGKRNIGKSGYNFSKLIQLSLNMLTNFSIFPLQLATIIGFTLSILGLFMAIFIVIKKIFFDIPVTGFASTIVTITIFSGAQLITIGLIGEYIGRIHLNINNKPQYQVRNMKEKSK